MGQPAWNKGNFWKDKYTVEEAKEIVNSRQQKYRAGSFKVRLNERMGAMMRIALKDKKNGRHWESLVGYSLQDLMKHLEKLFAPGMTWDNIREWHIDHIIPMSAFNFELPEHNDFKKCWALKNLQPLWAKDNLSKHAKLKEDFQPSLMLQ